MNPGTVTLVEDEIKIDYVEYLRKKTVKVNNGKGSYSSKISLPKHWADKEVLCLLLDKNDTKNE